MSRLPRGGRAPPPNPEGNLIARILSHPFRLNLAGTVATVDQDTEQADAEQLAVLALTRVGERPLVPAFGMTEPTFATFDVADFAAGVATFGPPVDIVNVTATPAGDSGRELLVTVEFD